MAAVRRVAYEAADSGLLSPELAVGIRRVKGVRRIGVRLGNWLTVDQGRSLLLNSQGDGLRSRRNYAILALLIGCGLRCGELLAICLEAWNCLNSDKASVPRYRQSFAVRLIAPGTWDVILNRVWRILVQVLAGLLSVGTEIR